MSDGASARGRSEARLRPSRQTLVTLVVVALTLALNLVQQPGLITFDTKLDLQFDPAGFLSRSLSLWNGDSAVGGLQNQASGYLFPMGPLFWLGHALGVPMWVWERLWSAAVMLLAYGGARRLASHWPGITSVGAVLAGLTYMLAPRVLTTVGGLSGETLPAAVLPWTVLPLVLYLRGKQRGHVAFLWSAATLPWMGGQNATLVFACLLLPAMLLGLTGGRTWRRRLRDLVVWGILVVLASLWWLVPLFLLGGYAPPFLDFIESAHNTASDTGWLSSMRGTSHWVAFFPGGGSAGWSGGYALASSPFLLVTTVLTAGAGLLGLARPDLWARRTLVATVLVGLAVLTSGTGLWAGSVLSGPWLDSLDTWLAPLRNVHKFDPLVRLPLSLGLGAMVSTGLPALLVQIRSFPSSRLRPAVFVLTAVVALVVGAAAAPAASGKLRSDDGMQDISSAWGEAVHYLNGQPGPVSVLVLPGSGFATQYWGRTVDEPIQVLGGPPWLARAQVTVAPAGTLRLMDSIERQVDQGRPQPELSAAFRRLGITHVVVRNDLNPQETDAPPPDVVYASLAGASDLRSVAQFGSKSGGHHEVEVFALDDEGADPRVSVMDWADRQGVQGGQEVVNELVAAGLVGADQATVLASGESGERTDIVTDSNQRIERSFGRVHAAASGIMTEHEAFRLPRPVLDYTGDQVPDAQTTAEYEGAELVTASSSRGYADILGPVRPEEHPYAAYDGSVFTAWATAPFTSPTGQWIEARFDEPADPGHVDLLFDTANGAEVQSVRLTTDGGTRTVGVGEDGRAADIDLPGTSTRTVRLTVAQASGNNKQVRLTDFNIRGHGINRSLRLPGEVTAGTAVHLSGELPRRACLTTETGVSCEQSRQRETPETAGFDRTVEVGEPSGWRLAGRAVATHGPATERLFAPLSDEMVSLTATSTFAGDPSVVAANAFDGRLDTGWYSSPVDDAPGLQLSWRKQRVIKEVTAILSKDQPGILPATLVVDPLTRKGKPQLVATTGDRAGVMKPVRTNRLRVTVLPESDRPDGVGLSELRIKGLQHLRFTPDLSAPTGVVCGFGPTIEIGGRTIETRVTGTLADVVDGAELEVQPCDTAVAPVGVGTQRIRVTNPAGFAVSNLWLEPPAASDAVETWASTAEVRSWSPTERTVAVRTQGEAVVVLAQSRNRGWRASIDGSRLEPVVIDGWKQAWHVPAGTSGDVKMEFSPQGPFRLGIVLGLVIAGLLSAAALYTLMLARRRPWGRHRRGVAPQGSPRETTWPPRGFHRFGMVAGAGILALVSIPLSLGAVLGVFTRRASFAALSLACAASLMAAAVIAITDTSSVVLPPRISDVIVALVVGAVAGRVLSTRDQQGGDRS